MLRRIGSGLRSRRRFVGDRRIAPVDRTRCRWAVISAPPGSRQKQTFCWPWSTRQTTSRFTRCSAVWRMIVTSRSASVRSGGSSIGAGLHGKKTAHASEQDRPDVLKGRQEWFDNQVDLDPEKLVFIDETGLSTKMARRYGRSPPASTAYSPAGSRTGTSSKSYPGSVRKPGPHRAGCCHRDERNDERRRKLPRRTFPAALPTKENSLTTGRLLHRRGNPNRRRFVAYFLTALHSHSCKRFYRASRLVVRRAHLGRIAEVKATLAAITIVGTTIADL